MKSDRKGYRIKNLKERDSMRNNKLLIPKRLTIETVFGCNASCTMCIVDLPTKRKKRIMPLGLSKYILDEMAPYKDNIQMLDFFGLGEPLLDPHLFERIKYAKGKGFRNIAISTNADLLNTEKQVELLDSGIDTVLFSVDGIKKKTHESIRKGVNFERVVKNCEDIIKLRDKENYKTRFVMRFIKQESNREEWPAFRKFWRAKLDGDKNDLIIIYDMHSWGGELLNKDVVVKTSGINPDIEKKACHHLENLIILSDGTVPLCSEDFLHGKYNFGNVTDSSPMEIFNADKFNKIRKAHSAGKKNTLELCKECTVLYSESTRKIEKA
ncbi:radical SAM protein [bacterium]|nr:radical SAM protein [bacterium]MBU4123806.1 radical SAM protein [bacterium]